jgi:hypothetical protein
MVGITLGCGKFGLTRRVKMLKHATLEFGDNFSLGPPLSKQEWEETLQRHRKAKIAELQAFFRKEIVLTEEERVGLERAAHGIWDS